MKGILTSVFGASWETTVIGWLVLACGSATLLGLVPPPFNVVPPAVCMLLQGLGFIRAKDANVSNSQQPGEAKAVNS